LVGSRGAEIDESLETRLDSGVFFGLRGRERDPLAFDFEEEPRERLLPPD
jgi:hypothetical protein